MLVGICNSQDGVYFGLAVQDSLAYLISGSLQVINVARPTSPSIVSTTNVFGAGVAVRDTFVYVPYGYDTLRVYSAANPQTLRLLGIAPLNTHTWDVALAESSAVVGTWRGLELFSLENPGQPQWRGSITASYGARCVVYSSPYFYTAMGDAGVAIYSIETVGLQEPASRRTPRRVPAVCPNPVGARCRVELPFRPARAVCIRDVAGRVVSAAEVETGRDNSLTLELSELAAGVYYLEVKADRETASMKFVKR